MNEEQFNHIGDRIKQAAMQDHPPYTEDAWERMEKMLDEQDRKRRPLFPLWFLYAVVVILSSVTIYWFVRDTRQPYASSLVASNNNIPKAGQATNGKNVSIEKNQNNKRDENDLNLISAVNATHADSTKENNDDEELKRSASRIRCEIRDVMAALKRNRKISEKARTTITIVRGHAEADGNELKTDKTNTRLINDVGVAVSEQIIPSEVNKDTVAKQLATAEIKTCEEKNKDSTILKITSIKTNEAKKKKRFTDRFFIGGSMGAEVSGVKFGGFENGSPAVKSGVSAGYKVSDRFAVMLGFYNNKKIYSARPQDYHPKAGSYLYAVNFTGADADCRVYDIPVTVEYNFPLSKKNKGFFSAGLSSYIMKTEDYIYKFTYYNIPLQSKHHYTGNSTFGSALNFSAGLEKQLNKKLSLRLEPSFSVPLRGVGDGHVKLYSSSINIGARYFPF